MSGSQEEMSQPPIQTTKIFSCGGPDLIFKFETHRGLIGRYSRPTKGAVRLMLPSGSAKPAQVLGALREAWNRQ